MANKVQYGFRNVVYSVITETNGAITYGTPVKMKLDGAGAINVALSPVGDSNDFYADDIIWFSETPNQGYEGDLGLTKITDAFKKDVLGMEEDINGALIENADATFKKFALGFEVQGNEKPTRTWYYYCQVSRPNDEANTKEASTTPATKTLTLKVMPRPTDMAVKVNMTKSSTNETAFNGFFDAVYEKTTTI